MIRFRQLLDFGAFRLTNVGTPTGGSDATTKTYCDGKVLKAGDSMQGDLNMGTHKVTNLGTPTATTDAATKTYVDGAVSNPPAPFLTTQTTNYTLGTGDAIVIANGSNLTITLGSASVMGSGKLFRIKNINSTLATLTVSGGGTIDGSTSVAIRQNEAFTVVSDGTNWYIV